MSEAWEFAEVRRESLIRFVMSNRATHAEAEDVVADVMIKFARNYHNVAPLARNSYLYSAALNRWRDILSTYAKSDLRLADYADITCHMDTSCELREVVKNNTSDFDYAVIDLRSEGLAFVEIGEAMGKSEKFVKNRFYRATERLRRKLAPVYG